MLKHGGDVDGEFDNLAISLPLMLALIYYSNHWN
jgi:hypothetical protein